MARFGKKSVFVGGLRVTDEETLEIARMVLVGNINSSLVTLIGKHGGKGIGLSGKDGQLIVARKKEPIVIEGEELPIDLGWVGEVVRVNPEIIMITAGKGYIPVISPIAVDGEGNNLNVNADTAAGVIAIALGAKKLISVTDVEGVKLNTDDVNSVISSFKISDFRRLVNEKVITGGMIPKVEACVKAVEGGVQSAHIVDGRRPHALLLELFTDTGVGTMIERG